MSEFEQKVAVITGAGSGLGREFARLLARQGAKLVLADVQEDALAAIERELREQGADVLAARVDVSKGAEVEALGRATMERFGAVHLVFNNAGVGAGGRIWESSVRDWEWVLGVNLWGVVHGVRVFMPLMLELAGKDPAYRGHIVNTSSVAGLLSAPGMGVYNVSKHGVVTLSETLHHDLQLANPAGQIGVSVLCPAFVPTGIASSGRNRPQDLQNAEPQTASQRAAQAAMQKAVESGRISAEEVARMTLDAIRERRFYIVTHAAILPSVKSRLEDVVQGRSPSDPFAHKPSVKPT